MTGKKNDIYENYLEYTTHNELLYERDKLLSYRKINSAFKSVSPYFYGDEYEFYNLAFDATSEIIKFLDSNYNYKLKNTDNILDIGCGVGRLERFIAPYVKHIIGIDISNNMIKVAIDLLKNFKNVSFNETFGDGSLKFVQEFDMIFSYGTFGFVEKNVIENYIKSGYKCLKPGGIFVFQIPNYKIWVGLFNGCDKVKIIERFRLLITFGLNKPTKKSKLGIPKNRKYLSELMYRYGFSDVVIKRSNYKRIYYLVSGKKPLK